MHKPDRHHDPVQGEEDRRLCVQGLQQNEDDQTEHDASDHKDSIRQSLLWRFHRCGGQGADEQGQSVSEVTGQEGTEREDHHQEAVGNCRDVSFDPNILFRRVSLCPIITDDIKSMKRI